MEPMRRAHAAIVLAAISVALTLTFTVYFSLGRPGPNEGSQTVRSSQREPAATSVYVAATNSNVFHRPECTAAGRIKPANVNKLHTREGATASGRRPCAACCDLLQ